MHGRGFQDASHHSSFSLSGHHNYYLYEKPPCLPRKLKQVSVSETLVGYPSPQPRTIFKVRADIHWRWETSAAVRRSKPDSFDFDCLSQTRIIVHSTSPQSMPRGGQIKGMQNPPPVWHLVSYWSCQGKCHHRLQDRQNLWGNSSLAWVSCCSVWLWSRQFETG